MENYINILREDERKKTNDFNKIYMEKYGFMLPANEVALAISTYDKVNQSGYRNYLPALLGDSYFRTAVIEVLIEDYNMFVKGNIQSSVNFDCGRKKQSKFIIESDIVDYIIVGNSTNLYITKQSPKTLHSIFENIIYLIHDHYGIEGVKNFIRKANYL